METKGGQKNIRGTETAARRDVTGPEMSSTHKDVKAWEQLPGTRGRSPRSPLGLTGRTERKATCWTHLEVEGDGGARGGRGVRR